MFWETFLVTWGRPVTLQSETELKSNCRTLNYILNKYEIYGTTYEYIYTYVHTDTARVQHVNVGLAQALNNHILTQIGGGIA